MTSTFRTNDILGLVDTKQGLVNRRVYSDKDLYQLELEQIFARAWNFMCHDSQIPNPGDFFMSYIGEDRVICVRDNEGNPQVLINSCRHRGNAVCRAEEGHASSFMCTYHGWTYDLKGNLVGVPGFKEVYHEELDRENWGLIKGRAESYRGWVFATLDPEAPSLHDYLGEVGRMGIDQVYARGKTVQVAGVQKWIIPCNWKFAVDNCWDFYHAWITHSSSFISGWRLGYIVKPGEKEDAPFLADGYGHIAVLGEYGHAIGGWALDKDGADKMNYGKVDQTWWDKPENQSMLGSVGLRSAAAHPNIFPNLWIFNIMSKASLRLPKGPTSTEVWWFIFTNPDASEEEQTYERQRIVRHDGPGGVFEQDDGENWGESTRGTTSTVIRRYPLHFAQNLGRGEVVHDETGPPHIDTGGNEHAQLWYYEQWTKWLTAASWSELAAMQAPPEGLR
jgi:phenylpropionate dioxygenase-like ring-hydroxylating dioxygenase large terminal subunit